METNLIAIQHMRLWLFQYIDCNKYIILCIYVDTICYIPNTCGQHLFRSIKTDQCCSECTTAHTSAMRHVMHQSHSGNSAQSNPKFYQICPDKDHIRSSPRFRISYTALSSSAPSQHLHHCCCLYTP